MQVSSFVASLFSFILLGSCTTLERSTEISSQSVHGDVNESVQLKSAKDSIIMAKQSLKLAIIKVNLMNKDELRDAAGRKKAVFMQALAFAPILSPSKESPFHLFKGDPIFTKLVPEFYQLLDALEFKRVPIVIDCFEVADCVSLRASLKKQYKLRVFTLKGLKSKAREMPYILMLSSENISLKREASQKFRTAFKYKWLNFPALYAQGLKIEQWANLVAKVKEF